MTRLALGAIGLALSCSSVLYAQAGGASETSGDVLSKLLAEVRHLRIAMERGATIPPRIQLLTSRLSMQEARVARLARDLDEVRDRLGGLADEQRRVPDQIKHYEAMMAENPEAPIRRDLEFQIKQLKQEVERTATTEQRLRAQEAELLASYTTEQAVWQEISTRLDELERSLARP